MSELLTEAERKEMSSTRTIPPWQRIAVDAATAAAMLSCGRSTFFERVKKGLYPKAGPDGRWSVNALRAVHQASSTTTA